VNEILASTEDMVQWSRRICVHKDIWSRESGDVSYFYSLRGLWIKAFVNEVNGNYEYEELGDGTQIIKRK